MVTLRPLSVSASVQYRRKTRRLVPLLLSTLALLPLATRAETPGLALRALIVGGGPEKEFNQVAIESNVRYLGKLLPGGTARTTLFADGRADNATVLYEEDFYQLPQGDRVLGLLLRGRDALDDNPSHYRKPNLGAKLDGASRSTEIEKAFGQLSRESGAAARPLLLYFTGHGSSNPRDIENNHYDLWNEKEGLSVRDLAAHLARLPQEVPVTIVMVQCFSGAFGNLLFEGGDPKAGLIDRDIAGFFAAVPDRVAAGCTSEVNEAEYHDFTSYFFAALTGRDRVGRRVTGADYNHDGRVGMDEAYCYTLANDKSIDVPVCTSDVFLRRFVPADQNQVFETPYSQALAWAAPGQRVVLETLSKKLQISGEDRLSVAFRKLFEGKGGTGGRRDRINSEATLMRRFETLRQEGRRRLFARFPELERANTPENKALAKEAATFLNRQAQEGQWDDLLKADEALHKADVESEGQAVLESYLYRFVRTGKSVILAHRLGESGDEAVKARYARLLAAEGRSLLPPATVEQSAQK